jgi:hypothetical protein
MRLSDDVFIGDRCRHNAISPKSRLPRFRREFQSSNLCEETGTFVIDSLGSRRV